MADLIRQSSMFDELVGESFHACQDLRSGEARNQAVICTGKRRLDQGGGGEGSKIRDGVSGNGGQCGDAV